MKLNCEIEAEITRKSVKWTDVFYFRFCVYDPRYSGIIWRCSFRTLFLRLAVTLFLFNLFFVSFFLSTFSLLSCSFYPVLTVLYTSTTTRIGQGNTRPFGTYDCVSAARKLCELCVRVCESKYIWVVLSRIAGEQKWRKKIEKVRENERWKGDGRNKKSKNEAIWRNFFVTRKCCRVSFSGNSTRRKITRWYGNYSLETFLKSDVCAS